MQREEDQEREHMVGIGCHDMTVSIDLANFILDYRMHVYAIPENGKKQYDRFPKSLG